MTESPSEAVAAENAPGPLEGYAASVAEAVGAVGHGTEHDTIKVRVAAERWAESLATAKHDLGLVFFSYLSAIDWANDVAVGDPPAEPVDDRYEVIAGVADLTEGRLVHFSTDIPKDGAELESLTGIYAGADWHEREAAEMFAIDFRGHPNLEHLYLPTDFEGHPLQKSYPLLSRQVKPWPGTVDVEAMPEPAEAPSTENPEG